MWRSRRDAIDNRGGDGSLKETTAAAGAQQDDAAGIEALPHQTVELTPLRQGRANDLAHSAPNNHKNNPLSYRHGHT